MEMTTTVHRHNYFLGYTDFVQSLWLVLVLTLVLSCRTATGPHPNETASKITIRFVERMMNISREELVRVYPLPRASFVVGLGMIMTAEVLTHGELLGIHTILDHGETTLTLLHLGVVMLALRDHGHQIVLTTGTQTTSNGPLKTIVRHKGKTVIEESSIRTIGSGKVGGGQTREVIILKSGGVTMAGKVDEGRPLKKAPHSRLQLQYPTTLDRQERTELGNQRHLGSPTTNGMATTKTRTKVKGRTRNVRIVIKGRRKNIINKRRIGVLLMTLI